MVDIDQYGIPIRMPESQHMSSDESTFWAGGDGSDSLTLPNANTSPTYPNAGSHSSTNGPVHIHKQAVQPTKSTRTWPASSPPPADNSVDNICGADTAAAGDWNMSSTAYQQSSLTASLLCSASDLRLCLGLQQQQQQQTTSSRLLNATLLPGLQYNYSPVVHSLTESEAELAQLTQGASFSSPCFFGGSPRGQGSVGEDVFTRQSTSLYGGLEERKGHQILSMPSQSITQSAYVGGISNKRDISIYNCHSKDFNWAEAHSQQHHYSGNSEDIDLGDINLRFSPFKSMTAAGLGNEPFPTFLSSDDGDSSFSSSADNLKTLADGGVLANKNNYFLTFQDGMQQSGMSVSLHPSNLAQSAASIFASREGKMDDSGAASSTGGGGSQRASTTSANRMKCWTDVIDDDGDDGGRDGEDVFKEQSFIASLTKERKQRAGSAQRLSTGSSENLTSGYSTSSMNGSGNGTGAFAYRPQLLRPTQRVRQSPSLPLNLQNGGQNSNLQTSPSRLTVEPPAFSIPRSRCSAPDLKFLASPQNSSQTRPAVPVQHPLSCPAKSELPFRVNNIEDWDSLRVLLPAAFQRAFSTDKKAEAHPTRSVSLPERMGNADDNVCPTCFKLQVNLSEMAASACDCSSTTETSSSTAASLHQERGGLERRTSHESSSPRGLLFQPVREFRRASIDRQYHPAPSANLMEFSRHLVDNSPSQLVINLKQKQELVTFVKAAAMGLVGFRQIQKDHSDSLSHVIEGQLASALHLLMEDGLRPGCTVWSTVVKQCSPTLYRRHLATMIDANENLTTDAERFHAFIKELLRLSDLNAWLMQVLQGNDSTTLRQYYSMDGFLFLASSVTKDLWDDLMDTLSWLSSSSQSSYNSFIQPDTGLKHSPRFQTSPGRQIAEQSASSNSVKRLASKLGRRISLLPVCTPTGLAGKKTSPTDPVKPLQRATGPPAPPRRMFTLGTPSSIQMPAQPHLPMSSRWSDWALSEQTHGPATFLPSQRLDVPNAARARKSPSMYDMRSVVL